MSRHQRRALYLSLVAAASGLFLPTLAHAEYWIGNGTTANWTATANWSATAGGATNNILPPTNDDVYFNLADAINRSITFDYVPGGFTPTYDLIQLNQTGTGALSLNNLNTANWITNRMVLGVNGHGNFSMNASGITIKNYLDIGENSPGSGTFTLSGGSVFAGSATIDVGVQGNGTFSHNAGNVYASTLIIASNSNSVGLYTLGNQFASLSVTNQELIGGGASGTFTQNDANNYCGSMTLANHGTYNLVGGTLNSGYNSFSTSDYLGDNGTATFNQTGGTHIFGQYSGGKNTLNIGAEGGNGSYLLKSGTLTVNGDMNVGSSVNSPSIGLLAASGGYGSVTGNITIAPTGTVTLSAGGLTAPAIINYGNFTHTNGILGSSTTVFTNYANFTATNSFGLFLGQFVNYGTYSADDSYLIYNGFINYTNLTISSGHTFTVNGQPLDNEQNFNLYGGTLNVGVGLLNNAASYLVGTLVGNGTLINNGQVTLGGSLTLNNTGNSTNNGNFLIGPGYSLHLNGAPLTNNATLTLGGGFVSGSQTLTNAATGTIVGGGFINTPFQNAGTLYVDTGTLNVSVPFTNTGVIQLAAGTASLIGGNIANNGTLQGIGSVGSNITNAGEIAPVAGTLTLNGALSSIGLLSIDVGSKLLARNFPVNAGIINLTGGTFDTAGHTLINNNQVSGYGTINTGGLTNNGSLTLTGATTTVNGNVTNNAGHQVQVLYTPAIFTGSFINNGIFKSTKTTVTFTGSYTENGTFYSDPATQTFGNVSIASSGVWLGSTGDQFIVTGNFISHSTANTTWNTELAQLAFSGATAHTMSINGTDLGATLAGFANNFSWGILALPVGDSIFLENDSSSPAAALYIHTLDLAGGLPELAAIQGPADSKIYYDATNPANAYLQNATYTLQGGLTLAPVPEPASLAVLTLVAPALLRRRRR